MVKGGQRTLVSVDDFLSREETRVAEELIRGTVVEKAAPSSEHSRAQAKLGRHLGGPFDRKPGGRQPGGWWFFSELDVRLGGEVLRPDVCGYRRDRLAAPPRGRAVTLAPDWVCEVLSPTTATRDRVEKLQTYFAAGVSHYWLIDPEAGSLEVLRRTDLAYALVQTAHRGQRLRPEPFEALEFSVDVLLGDDAADDEP